VGCGNSVAGLFLLLFSVAKGNKKRVFHPAHSCGHSEDPWSGQTSHLVDLLSSSMLASDMASFVRHSSWNWGKTNGIEIHSWDFLAAAGILKVEGFYSEGVK
jgi:hypothetical protein